MGRSKILIVEDDAATRGFLHVALARCGYEVIGAANGAQALHSAATEKPALVLMDLGLPDIDGMQLLAKLREGDEVRVIVVSGRSDELALVEALDRGANDFVAKPFGVNALLARVRVALRGGVAGSDVARAPQRLFELGPWHIDFENHTAHLGRRRVHLTPTEYKLLAVLVARLGSAVSHGELLRAVWGPESSEQVEYLRTYVRQLRCKLELEPSHPRYLLTVPRIGYRLSVAAR